MSIHIDPEKMKTFSSAAGVQAQQLGSIKLNLKVPDRTLGSFDEATDLVKTINAHTDEVNQRLQATSDALVRLGLAAAEAAKLSGDSDAAIAARMKTVNGYVDDARRKLITPKV